MTSGNLLILFRLCVKILFQFGSCAIAIAILSVSVRVLLNVFNPQSLSAWPNQISSSHLGATSLSGARVAICLRSIIVRLEQWRQ